MSVLLDRLISILIVGWLLTFLISSKSGIFVILIFLLSLGGLFLKRNEKKKLAKSEVLFISSFIIYFIVSSSSVLILGGELRELDTLSRFILVLPIFFYIRKSSVSITPFFISVCFTTFLLSMHILAKKFFGLHFLELYKNTSFIGFYLSFFSILCILAINPEKSIRFNAIFLLVGIVGIISAMLTGSRGAFISSLASIGYILFSNHFNLSRRNFKYLFYLMIMTIPIIFLIPKNETSYKFKQIYSQIVEYQKEGNAKSSIGARLEMYKTALIIAQDNLFFGIGENNFVKTKAKLIQNGNVSRDIESFNHPHSEYLTSLVEQGLLGLSSLIFLYISSFYFARHEKHNSGDIYSSNLITISIISLVIFYATYSIFNGVFDHQTTTLFYTLVIAIMIGILSSLRK